MNFGTHDGPSCPGQILSWTVEVDEVMQYLVEAKQGSIYAAIGNWLFYFCPSPAHSGRTKGSPFRRFLHFLKGGQVRSRTEDVLAAHMFRFRANNGACPKLAWEIMRASPPEICGESLSQLSTCWTFEWKIPQSNRNSNIQVNSSDETGVLQGISANPAESSS